MIHRDEVGDRARILHECQPVIRPEGLYDPETGALIAPAQPGYSFREGHNHIHVMKKK